MTEGLRGIALPQPFLMQDSFLLVLAYKDQGIAPQSSTSSCILFKTKAER
jgi:hypothetical protein